MNVEGIRINSLICRDLNQKHKPNLKYPFRTRTNDQSK